MHSNWKEQLVQISLNAKKITSLISKHTAYLFVFITELPIIVADSQSKYRSEGENVTLCCQAKPATGVTYKW